MVGIFRIISVAFIRLLPRNAFPFVLDYPSAGRNLSGGEYAIAVNFGISYGVTAGAGGAGGLGIFRTFHFRFRSVKSPPAKPEAY